MAHLSHTPFSDPADAASATKLHPLGDPIRDHSLVSQMTAGLMLGAVHGALLWILGTALSWGMASVGYAALVGVGVGVWHGVRQRLIVPLAVVCWAMGAMCGVALFIRLNGMIISPLSGVIAWLLGATVARSVTRTMTDDEESETVRSACVGGLIGGGVGWPVGAIIAGTIPQLLEDPWSWTVVGAGAGAVIGLMEAGGLGVFRMVRQSLFKAIGGAVLLFCAFYGDGLYGWIVGAALIWMVTIAFFTPARRHSGPVTGVAVAPEGELAVSCSTDRTARFWELWEERQIGYLQRSGAHAVTAVAFSHDGEFAVAGRDDGRLMLLDGNTGRERWRVVADAHAVRCAAPAANDAKILSGGDEGVVRLWDFDTGAQVRQFTGHRAAATCIAIAPNGPYFASGDVGGVVRFWNFDNGTEIGAFNDFTKPVHAVVFSHDGRYLFVADGQTIYALDPHTGTKVRTYEQPNGPAHCLAVMPGQALLISGGPDGVVRFWDSDSGKEMNQLHGHDGPVNCISVSEDGSAIVTGGEDCTVRAVLLDDESDDEEDEEADVETPKLI